MVLVVGAYIDNNGVSSENTETSHGASFSSVVWTGRKVRERGTKWGHLRVADSRKENKRL
jgi:hypothetical protein